MLLSSYHVLGSIVDPKDGGNKFLRHVGEILPDNIASHAKEQRSSQSLLENFKCNTVKADFILGSQRQLTRPTPFLYDLALYYCPHLLKPRLPSRHRR